MRPHEIIKGYRERMGLTQENVATFLEVPRELISFYENGLREPPINVYERLADLFGIELSDFFEEIDGVAKTNIAFAFRASELQNEDLKKIAEFRRIIHNHFKLLNLKKEHDQ